MRKRHSVLILHIGTFAEEDEAYELLNRLRQSLPFVVIITSLFDALLAAVYLKWLHPWRILLQEVSSLGLNSGVLTSSKAPDQWEIELESDTGTEQDNEVVFI